MSEREYKALRSVPASTWMEGFCVTKQMEEGNDKLAEKGWREYRVDMLSSSTVRVTYVRGEPDEDEDLDLDGEGE